MAKNNIKVEKGAFEYKGKTYSEYFICGNVRGRDVKIKIAPPDKNDKGGYTVLDIVFGNEDKADFFPPFFAGNFVPFSLEYFFASDLERPASIACL